MTAEIIRLPGQSREQRLARLERQHTRDRAPYIRSLARLDPTGDLVAGRAQVVCALAVVDTPHNQMNQVVRAFEDAVLGEPDAVETYQRLINQIADEVASS